MNLRISCFWDKANMKTKLAAAVLCALIFGMAAAQAAPKSRVVEGTITHYECGDNCYLTIRDSNRRDHVGLCTAPLCQSWNQNAKIPNRFIGKPVKVTVGRGKQVDGEGTTVMGTFDAFNHIELLSDRTVPVPEKAQNYALAQEFNNQEFARYEVAKVYRGPPRMPDFRGRDSSWTSYRTRIRQGVQQGSNFAGHLAMVEIGCGTGCRIVPVVDIATGHVIEFPYSGEDYGLLNLHYQRNSRLVVAFWMADERCFRGSVEWTGTAFKALGRKDLGPEDVCYSIPRMD